MSSDTYDNALSHRQEEAIMQETVVPPSCRALTEGIHCDETHASMCNTTDPACEERRSRASNAKEEGLAARRMSFPPPTTNDKVAVELINGCGQGCGGKEEEAPSSSSEEGVDSSSGSGPVSSGAAVVTSTTTNSSGDDQGSRTQNSSSGGDEPVKMSRDSLGRAYHLSYRQRERTKNSDGYGLPVPRDDRVQAPSVLQHTKVVAHLPPPSSRDNTSSSSGGEGERGDETSVIRSASLLQPHHEPAFHTIRRALNQFVNRNSSKGSESDVSGEQAYSHKHKSNKRVAVPVSSSNRLRKRVYGKVTGKMATENILNDDSGGSSGSGSDEGYIGSASSNENGGHGGSCSSPSLSSSEESTGKGKHLKGKPTSSVDPTRPLLSRKQESSVSMSSEIADFSSGISESEVSSSDQEDTGLFVPSNKRQGGSWSDRALQVQSHANENSTDRKRVQIEDTKPGAHPDRHERFLDGKPPILSVGCDVIAHVLTFLEPPEILEVLTAPLCKDWLTRYTRQPELWRVLCLVEPFKARIEGDGDFANESDSSDPFDIELQVKRTFGEFRLMYTSFVRCMRYLARIKDDAVNCRQPSAIEYASSFNSMSSNVKSNHNFQHFLSRARGLVVRNRTAAVRSESSVNNVGIVQDVARAMPVELSDDGSYASSSGSRRKKQPLDVNTQNKRRKVQYAPSSLTQRLLGPSASGAAGNVELPWSCAIYSIMNWMTAFADVEGIQTICLKVLPFLLENEQQRITAQRAGLTDIVLRAMVLFPSSCQLHTAAFHTIVLLARPLGGREGMLFHTSVQSENGIFNAIGGHSDGRNGIAVMLDSMRRFRLDPDLQAMSCWSLVNIALVSAQKEALVKLGGIQVAANAIMLHPRNAEVVYRAMFALINLVIPSVPVSAVGEGEVGGSVVVEDDVSEKAVLDEIVDQVVSLVVMSMKNFCASEAILNRACLVLHNLSLTQEYHRALLWTPDCYQMLEWCMANYRSDQVLQQSAAGTLHRLQLTLSGDEALRARFAASLQAQQQLSLERAHQEALRLLEHQQVSQLQEPPQNS